MREFPERLLSSDFMPHSYCYLWKPALVWLHVVPDALMLAYFSIPVTLINSYESSVYVIDSMVNQHAKRLEKGNDVPWRMKVSSLNILVSGLIWRQDHNGFTHQDPGFLDVVANKSPSVVRIYLPPDANCLLSVGDHCFRSQNYVNVIVADKQPQDMQYLEWRQRSPSVPRAWASGTGPATTRGRSPTCDRRAAATCRR